MALDAASALGAFCKWLAPQFNRKAAAMQKQVETVIASGDEAAMRQACREARKWILDRSRAKPSALIQWLEEGAADPRLFER